MSQGKTDFQPSKHGVTQYIENDEILIYANSLPTDIENIF